MDIFNDNHVRKSTIMSASIHLFGSKKPLTSVCVKTPEFAQASFFTRLMWKLQVKEVFLTYSL